MTEPIRQTREMGQTGRRGNARAPSAGPSLPSSPFLRSTHAAARPIEAERSRENEINCLAQSTALPPSVPFPSLVARVERAREGLALWDKSYGFSVKLFWVLGAARESSPSLLSSNPQFTPQQQPRAIVPNSPAFMPQSHRKSHRPWWRRRRRASER